MTRGCAAKRAAMASAPRQLAATRKKSVRIPRNKNHASKGPRTAPRAAPDFADIPPRLVVARGHQRAGDDVAMPFRYLLAECSTRSAPYSIGRVRTGVATVESTTTRGGPSNA